MWEKLKTKRFWLAIGSAIVIVLQACGLTIDAPVVNEIISGICTILVLFGFLTGETTSSESSDDDSLGEEFIETEQDGEGEIKDDNETSQSTDSLIGSLGEVIEVIADLVNSDESEENDTDKT